MRIRNYLLLICLFVCLSVPRDVLSGASNLELLVPREVPGGWALRGTPQVFTKETLFEHIDGQADLFLQYGFERSIFAVYENKNSSQEKIDLDIHDMDDVVQAFGIFSRFRQGEHAAGIGLDSCLDDRYALFYKGKYFVVLQATDSNPSSLKQLARIIESRITDSSPPPKELAYFPKRGLKPGSIEYFPEGLLGHQFLKKGFKASYVENNGKRHDAKTMSESRDFHLFLSIFENSQEARNALRLFKEHLSKKGKLVEQVSTWFGPDALTGVDPYQGKTIVVHKGPYLVGAVGFEQDKDGERRLAELMKEVN
jgi:hypothetical protein